MTGATQPRSGTRRLASAAIALLVTLTPLGCQGNAPPAPARPASVSPTPWRPVLAEPQVPPADLAIEHGGPAVPGRVCIETAIDPIFLDPAVYDPVADIARPFAVLGIKVVSVDCDAILRVQVNGHRIGALYVPSGRCYDGWDVSGAFAWSVGGTAAGRWPVSDHRDPPASVAGCRKQDATIRLGWLESWQIGGVLTDLFGGAGFAALWLVFPGYPPTFPRQEEAPPSRSDAFKGSTAPPDPAVLTPAACDAAVSRIAHAFWRSASGDERDWLTYRLRWFASCPCGESRQRVFIPYLIAALADEEQSGQKFPHTGLLLVVLTDITGQTFGSADRWWEWWQRQQE